MKYRNYLAMCALSCLLIASCEQIVGIECADGWSQCGNTCCLDDGGFDPAPDELGGASSDEKGADDGGGGIGGESAAD